MQINGYEGLSIDITLSSKFLVPLVKISYSKIAPSGAKDQIDDIEGKLRDHYGVIYTDASKYQTEVLEKEKSIAKFGQKLCEVSSGNKTFDLHKVCLTEPEFDEKQFYLQGILTFFIDGASKVDVNRFWHYFILYDKESGDIAGFTICYQAHRNAKMFRTKLALIFIYPTYQKMGLGSKLYESVLNHYVQD